MIKVMQTSLPARWAADKQGKDWATSMEDDTFAESFTAGMNSRGAYLARGLSKAFDFQEYNTLLDIGGGSGIYSIIILENNTDINAAIFEKAPVDKVVKYNINKRNMNDRIKVIEGDMFRDKLPAGYDIHLLSHVLHDWDFNEVRVILKNSYSSLNPGGKIIIHDAHINRTKTGPISVAEYSVLLMFLSEGKCYSIKEMKDVLKETGFKNIEYHPTIYNRSVITGVK
jgi:SAM-dependent methyltransferase